jgi:hypothetical protein
MIDPATNSPGFNRRQVLRTEGTERGRFFHV